MEKKRRAVRKGWRRGGWKACGGVKMGCIMTPMPNHLSTCLSLFYHIRVVRMKGKEQCGKGRSVEMVRVNG